ncbi:AbiJ-NTD4 domain-containing protein [Pedobacter agri]|uniref:AbiJ-NTD4 domain-containing protein n=1 Tax=Pedobacter agri TaxID=454586 RepID=UPI0029309A40|nr:hypothetical protein [Pedobacter agri]
MPSFSQRKGIKPIRSIFQVDSADELLRNQLWNTIIAHYWSDPFYYDRDAVIHQHLENIWINHYGNRVDELPRHLVTVVAKVKDTIVNAVWYEMYDLLEDIPNAFPDEYNTSVNDAFFDDVNEVLKRHLAGYRFLNGLIVDITSDEELETIESAIGIESKFLPVSQHLKRALELLTDRLKPDYRNSIKESISSVESIASIITGKPKATLGQALAELEKFNTIHSTLKSAFSILYGWTSDAEGIRHKLIEQSQVKQEDAKFMLITCSAFINYLISKVDH